ncbi:MAG: hypothetical protein ABI876_03620 [Bacteroidota bacterium]
MKKIIRGFIPIFMTIVLLAAIIAPREMTAACANVTITNNSGCTVNITFYDATNATFTVSGITPGSASYPWGAFVPVGVVGSNGVQVPFVNGCSDCIKAQISGAVGFCCTKVCRGPNCTMTLSFVANCSAAPCQ